MKLSGKVPCLLFLMGLVNLTFGQNQIRWPLVVEPPNQAGVEIGHFYNLPKDKISFSKAAGGIQVKGEILPQPNFVVFKAEASSESNFGARSPHGGDFVRK